MNDPVEQRKIHVVMVSKALVVGAYQKKLEEIAAFPDIRLTAIVPAAWGTHQAERSFTKGYDLITLPIVFNGKYHLFHLRNLKTVIAKLAPDLIHIDEEPYNYASYQVHRIARRLQIPTIFFSWQNLERRYPFPFSYYEKEILAYARHALVGNSEAVHVWRQKGYDGPIDVIPQFGVDPDFFSPPSGRQGGPFTIGYAGRFVPEKGLDLIIRAAAKLRGEWHLSLLGSGPEKERLSELAGLYNMGGNVKFEDPIPSLQMPDYYRTLDAFVLPSRTERNWKEQFGRVLIEAMACGVPVIGSDSGAIPEVLGPAGLVFDEGDSDSLAHRLQQLMDDEDLRERLAQAGRQRVLNHYTQKIIAEDTVRIYRRVVT